MRRLASLGLLLLAGSAAAGEIAEGTFVQRKHLAGIGVTLRSTGRFRFAEGQAFVWHTLKPAESVFTATPTNYSFTVGGTTESHPLATDIRRIEDIFALREVKQLVEKVDLKRAPGDTGILPAGVSVRFRNGDRTDIELKKDAAPAVTR